MQNKWPFIAFPFLPPGTITISLIKNKTSPVLQILPGWICNLAKIPLPLPKLLEVWKSGWAVFTPCHFRGWSWTWRPYHPLTPKMRKCESEGGGSISSQRSWGEFAVAPSSNSSWPTPPMGWFCHSAAATLINSNGPPYGAYWDFENNVYELLSGLCCQAVPAQKRTQKCSQNWARKRNGKNAYWIDALRPVWPRGKFSLERLRARVEIASGHSSYRRAQRMAVESK